MVNVDDEKDEKTSKSGYAYTPGLKIKRNTKVVKVRRLPIRGEVLAEMGDSVSFDDIVAKTSVPGDPTFVKGSMILGVEPEELLQYMVKKENDPVKENEVLAKYDALFGLIKKRVCSPIDGVMESFSGLTGQIIVRGNPKPVAINAYIPGKITEVRPEEGVTIETMATFIQGIFGIGGESHGKLKVLVKSPEETLTDEGISEEEKGCIVVGGSDITFETLEKAVKMGVNGIVAGGIDHSCLVKFIGGEIGVAITGEEDIPLTLIITEGFGKMAMSRKTFELLRRFEGETVCINGATQIRAGVIRPEIVIPHQEEFSGSSELEISEGIVPGTPVRIIAEPHFGAIGVVTLLPVELKDIETESHVRVLNVKLEDGKMVQVPRANIEIIEE